MKRLFSTIFKSWYFRIGLIGLVLRLVLMPITFHPDFFSLNSSRYFLVEKRVWNFYDYLASLSADNPLSRNYGRNYFTYPPLSYFTFGFFSVLLKPFYANDITGWLIEHYPNIFSNSELFKLLFLFKLPYLLFDFGIAYYLVKIFDNQEEKKKAYLLWLFNPVSIYAAYMVGQFELIPLFFVVLALFLVKMKKLDLAVVSLGIGGAYKMFPLFFVPILAFSLGKNFWEKVKLLVLGFLPFFISIIPFLGSSVFRQLVLFSNQSQKFLYMNLPVSGAEGIFVFVFIWGIIFFTSLYDKNSKNILWLWFLAIMLTFFSVTHYHPQWFVWLTPLLVIQIIKTKFKLFFMVITIFISWFLVTLFFEPSLNFALFAPLNPRLLDYQSLAVIINKYYDVFQLKSLIRSLFASVSLVMVFYSLKLINEKEKH